jgi:hypothetical protein
LSGSVDAELAARSGADALFFSERGSEPVTMPRCSTTPAAMSSET